MSNLSGEVIEKEVEKLLYAGKNTAVVRIPAEVCLHCGERLYAKDTVTLFERIHSKLEQQDVAEFEPLGSAYWVAA